MAKKQYAGLSICETVKKRKMNNARNEKSNCRSTLTKPLH